MKTIIRLTAVCAVILAVSGLWLASCAGGPDSNSTGAAASEGSSGSLTLDAAIDGAASYFNAQIASGAKVALVPFDAPVGRLSDYVFEELWGRFEDSRKFVMVDRRNLERIDAEIRYQLGSGRVDDNLAVSITSQYGAEVLVYGQIVSMGQGASAQYRMTIYATDVAKASSSQRAFNIRPDNRLAALLNASAEDEVERAVAAMARELRQRTTIAVGRFSYGNTQTVSSLSAWLKTSIIAGAQKQRDKFLVASDDESADFAVSSRGLTVETPAANSAIQAVVSGNYTPLDSGAEVLLQLISTSGNRVVLASARFVIPAPELERRRLSLLPEQGSAIMTQAQLDARQQAVDPYAGRNNRWAFTVTPDVLDGIYRDGDYMTMRVYSERDCYFRIIHVDVNGATQVIYPSSPRDDNYIRAGQTRRIPDNTRYRMNAPFGEEIILAAAYDRPFTADQQTGQLNRDSITRGLTVESDSHTAMSPSVTARFSYTILPR